MTRPDPHLGGVVEHLELSDFQLDYLEHFAYRVLQDALNEATRSYWLRRAETFEWAKPNLADFHGRPATSTSGTPSDNARLSQQWRRADETAQACRNRAEVALIQDEYPEDVWGALREAGEPCQDEATRLAS